MKQTFQIAFTIVLAAPAFAAPAFATPGPQTDRTAAATDREKVICKSTPLSGSLARPKKVCLTKDAWEEMRRDAKEYGRERIDGCGARNADPNPPGAPPAPTC